MKIVNEMDLKKIKADIKESITHYILYDSDCKTNKTDMLVCISEIIFPFIFVCFLAFGLYIAYYGYSHHISQKIACLVLLCYTVILVLIIIGLFKLDIKFKEIVTKKHIEKIHKELNKAQNLGDICKIIDYIVQKYYSGSAEITLNDLLTMRKTIQSYEEVKNLKIIEPDEFKNGMIYLFIEKENGDVDTINFPANFKENTHITEDMLVFKNWMNPVYIRPYQ